MNIKLQRKSINGCFVNIYETPYLIFGFTEIHFSPEDLSCVYPDFPHIVLEQVHSDIILFSSEIDPAHVTEGDGIILDQVNKMAIIETADCTPLFFWFPGSEAAIGGVIHIGWKGLCLGIEKRLIRFMQEKFPGIDLPQMHVFLGPSIEAKCYEVGNDLYEAFASKSYRDDIFFKIEKSRLVMDVKKGIRLSLMECGIPGEHIMESSLCTFCEPARLPSYRRAKGTGLRIHNFLCLPRHNR
jgi:polyphenol oxidase